MKNHKFKSLKVFCSDEWLVNRTREYRSVFDESELTYVSAEFAFYNKRFDEQSWETNLTLKAFSHRDNQKTEICSQSEKRTILPSENVVYFNKGWGMSTPASFWKEGEYTWEAFVEDERVGTALFFVENAGKVTPSENPYFDIDSIRFYAGEFNETIKLDKVYLAQISKNETPYLYTELRATNKLEKDWNCEIVFNWYNASGLLKARIERMRIVKSKSEEPIIIFSEGWGNDKPGTWRDDKYRLEVVFMDNIIAVMHLPAGEKAIAGDIDFTEAPHTQEQTSEPEEPKINLEQLVQKFDNLVGLDNLRTEIYDHLKYIQFLKLRTEKGLPDNDRINIHSVFTGNPGTGKTTVVKLLGGIYHSMGLLSKGHVKEVDRSHLIGEYIGQTAPKVKKAIEEAKGGILFIDEAYALAREGDDNKDFGKEALEVLIKEMSDGDPDIAIMVAGYPKEMEVFLKSNPGLRSRFGNFYHLEDYSPEELQEIVARTAVEKNVTLTDEANKYLYEQLVEGFRTRDKSFGNARYAIGLLNEAKMNMGLRLMKHDDINALTQENLSTITIEDIEKIFGGKDKKKIHLKINEKLLADTIQEIDKLEGINNIKNEVNELVKLVRFYNETGKDVMNRFSLHTVFLGNPGTGKTTVARLFGKLFKALGLLERGHLIELDKQGLVAGFTGQTAIKTEEKIQEAKGGVLFIDEAYSLMDGGFGNEAIEILLKRMEDMRGEIAVIAAGYTEPMKHFLESNPGLKSRFDRTYLFEDYNATELYKIGLQMLVDEKMYLEEEADVFLRNLIKSMYDNRDKNFGNARAVRKLIGEIIHKQHLRLASMDKETRTPDLIDKICLADVQLLTSEDLSKRKGMGFKLN
jgi:SpoVK/Ycf46/Vps4 family AAA+-type ATPase